jgi:hypothetical protein
MLVCGPGVGLAAALPDEHHGGERNDHDAREAAHARTYGFPGGLAGGFAGGFARGFADAAGRRGPLGLAPIGLQSGGRSVQFGGGAQFRPGVDVGDGVRIGGGVRIGPDTADLQSANSNSANSNSANSNVVGPANPNVVGPGVGTGAAVAAPRAAQNVPSSRLPATSTTVPRELPGEERALPPAIPQTPARVNALPPPVTGMPPPVAATPPPVPAMPPALPLPVLTPPAAPPTPPSALSNGPSLSPVPVRTPETRNAPLTTFAPKNVPGPLPFRAGYSGYLQRASTTQLAAMAVPGATGIFLVTASGAFVGYRRARAGHVIHVVGLSRFIE